MALHTEAIKQGVNENHPLFPLTHAIKFMLGDNWAWKISHIPREKNMAADFLAKWSCNQPRGLQILSRPPNDLNPILGADSLGVSHPRIVM
ncbi:hypothetical protein COLO4_26305 [Corchorus olitorius]|uniref:RNase H type-1 domain-containing protein n=1 Tax=Corchorus olitorius TaxID=93759 RepID=A0A1R3HXS9_9ROSI|nr:hypothetical protein COLO4_26305 [Corchorus olitorius]